MQEEEKWILIETSWKHDTSVQSTLQLAFRNNFESLFLSWKLDFFHFFILIVIIQIFLSKSLLNKDS